MKHLIRILILVLAAIPGAHAQDKRSRSEGLPGVSASNTVGTGNIWLGTGGRLFMQSSRASFQELENVPSREYYPVLNESLDTTLSLTKKDVLLAPAINGTIGLTGFMHLEFESSPWDGEKIGLTTAGLKFTLPGNDNLRVWGAAARFNVTLSTEENSFTKLEETPAFDPLLSYTLIGDADLVKMNPKWPYKVYLNYSNSDNFRFHYTYSQHRIALGFEKKGDSGGYYLRSGMSFYKEKENSKNQNPDDSFLAPLYELGLGYKKRFAGAIPFSIIVDLEMDPTNPIKFLESEIRKPLKLDVSISFPLYFRETNAEALRSLIFSEQARKSGKLANKAKKGTNRTAKDLTLNRLLLENFDRDMLDDELLNEVFQHSNKEDEKKRRAKIKKALIEDQKGSE